MDGAYEETLKLNCIPKNYVQDFMCFRPESPQGNRSKIYKN